MKIPTLLRRGFTLIEILVVVIILGILAAIVIPRFMDTGSEAQVASAQHTLATVRAQIELFKLHHNDSYPGLTANSSGTSAWGPMLIKTDAATTSGTTAVAGGRFGPYFTVPPANAMNNLAGIRIADLDTTTAKATTSAGWVWDSTDGKIKAMVPAVWRSGKVPYSTGGTTLNARYVGDFTK
ncbi:MAG: prepilin-type N-terminal cleavage/methylation domain-containing protein [Phycisphaerae bacterium]